MERFVLLRHTMPAGSDRADHWDLMLEAGGVLRTWELLTLPAAWSAALGREMGDGEAGTARARVLADHRLEYLDYEGPLSDGRGDVRREDGGGLRWIEDSQTAAVAQLNGAVLQGVLRLTVESGSDWRLSLASS